MLMMGTLLGIRAVLLPTRRRRGTVEFIGLRGFDGLEHQKHSNTRLLWTLIKLLRDRIHVGFQNDKGVPGMDCIGS